MAVSRRFILTGAPGAGKTTVLRALADLGHDTVAEAATDVIAGQQAAGTGEPWREPGFVDAIAALQRLRQQQAAGRAEVQFYDRSPVCTLALAHYLGQPVSPALAQEIARITAGLVYQRQVFFIRPIGFVTPTAARRISYPESLVFEREHEAQYLRLGFEIVDVPPAAVAERAALIDAHVRGEARGR
jgi:predicted ATPase